MTSKTNSDIALGDVRSTSYNAETANPDGYQGTIDDAIAQVRAEPDEVRAYWPLNISRERHELLGFLGVHKSIHAMSGLQEENPDHSVRDSTFRFPEDDSVEYGVEDVARVGSKWGLAYAMERWPENFSI